MKHFAKLPSLVQIIVAEVLMVLMVTPLVATIAGRVFQPTSATVKTTISWGDAVWFALGLALLAWLLRGIFRPHIEKVSWVPAFGAGGAVVWNSSWASGYALPSTHPAFVLVDAVAAAFAGVIAYLWLVQFDDMWVYAWSIIGVGVLVPVLRLFAWFALGLTPARTFADQAQRGAATRVSAEAWKPVAHLYGWFFAPLVLLFVIFGYRESAADARAYAALPAVTEAELARRNPLLPLRDHTDTTERRTKRVRLTLVMKSAAPMVCQGERNKNRFTYVGVVLSAGEAGDVFVAGLREQGEAIVALTKGRAGQRIEVVGRLNEMPAALPEWKWYCDLDKIQPRPRWSLDVEGYPWAPAKKLMAK
jgi:hypothetical protein